VKILDAITSRLLLIFPDISENFWKISVNVKFPENLQPYSLAAAAATADF